MALDNKEGDTTDFNRIFRESFISEDLRLKIQELDPILRDAFLEMENQLILFCDRIETLECVTDQHLKEEREQTEIDMERVSKRIGRKALAYSKQVAALALSLFGAAILWGNLTEDQKQKVAGSFYEQAIGQIAPAAFATIAGALLVNSRKAAKESKDE
jgi:hypothetical protein